MIKRWDCRSRSNAYRRIAFNVNLFVRVCERLVESLARLPLRERGQPCTHMHVCTYICTRLIRSRVHTRAHTRNMYNRVYNQEKYSAFAMLFPARQFYRLLCSRTIETNFFRCTPFAPFFDVITLVVFWIRKLFHRLAGEFSQRGKSLLWKMGKTHRAAAKSIRLARCL
mgnify:CR=1 FL=1